MKEKDIWKKYSPELQNHGLAIRLENSVSNGVSDIIFITHRKVLFIEVKILKAGKIKLEPYQVAWHTKAMRYLHSYYDVFWIAIGKEIWSYTWSSLSNCPKDVREDGVYFFPDKAHPDFILTGPADIVEWLRSIKP
jgi:hypothetical protein